jgi:SAM-dependent methyltransferase
MRIVEMFSLLEKINQRPNPFEFCNSEVLWNTPYLSKNMLKYHLDENVDIASRKKAFIEKSIEWMTSYFSLGSDTKICDFGCGPGLYTLGLSEKKAVVTGIDFSRNSIEYARKKADLHGVRINYVLENYLNFETNEKFDLITLIMCDFCALSPEQRRKILTKFGNMLNEGGSILLDAYSINAFNKRNETTTYEHQLLEGFWSEDDYYGFLNTFKYPVEKVILDQYTIVEKRKTWQIFNWLQYFNLETITNEIENCNFVISEIFSDVAGMHYSDTGDEFALVLKKR